jgi:hypothetical protein
LRGSTRARVSPASLYSAPSGLPAEQIGVHTFQPRPTTLVLVASLTMMGQSSTTVHSASPDIARANAQRPRSPRRNIA